MNIAMTLQRRTRRLLAALTLAPVALVGCGESDLDEQHDRALADARLASAPEPAAGVETIDLTGYTLAFRDEFRADALDATRWNTALPWGPDVVVDGELQHYVDVQGGSDIEYSPFSLDGEHLIVRAVETPEASRAAANEQPWLSGALSTAELFDTTYGYVEARVDLPSGRGVSPGFLMLGSEETGTSPQLSVMEQDGARPDSVFHNYEYVAADGIPRSPGRFEVSEPGLSEGFHTFGVLWSPGELKFFVDGVARYRIIGEDVPAQDMYLVLALAIGGTWPGAPDATTPRPLEWAIDYVRVWQKRADG